MRHTFPLVHCTLAFGVALSISHTLLAVYTVTACDHILGSYGASVVAVCNDIQR
jgi:hypothetical protein